MVAFDDGSGHKGVLPFIHAELVLAIRPGPNARAPAVTADVRWYQGVPTTGFFPQGLFREPPWCGESVTDTFRGKDARRAVGLAGLLSDAIHAAATQSNLVASGYDVTEVCNDFVAVVHHAMTGRATEFPLLMRDEALLPECTSRVPTSSRWPSSCSSGTSSCS